MKNAAKFLIFISIIFVLVSASTLFKKGFEVGDSATDFKLKNVDGRMVSMKDFSTAKGFIIVFDCNTCPYSKAYNKRIISLNKKYNPRGFQLITINANDPSASPMDSYDEMIKEAKTKGYDFPYLLDDTQDVAKTYGATNTPHVFVLSKSNTNIRVEYIGTIDDNARNADAVKKRYVEDAVDAILNGKEILVKKTKALGCGIKWKNS